MRFASIATFAAVAATFFAGVMGAPAPAPGDVDVRAPEPSAELLEARAAACGGQCSVHDVLIQLEIDVGSSCHTLGGLGVEIDIDVVLGECKKLTGAIKIAIAAILKLKGFKDIKLIFGLIGYVGCLKKLVAVILLILNALVHVIGHLKGHAHTVCLPVIQAVVFLLGDLIAAILGLLTGVLGYLLVIVLGLLGGLFNPCKPLLWTCGDVCYNYWKHSCGLTFL